MNAATHIGPYQRDLAARLGCSPQDAAMMEDIMRRFVFHSTLDWQSRAELDRGAREAWAMLRTPDARGNGMSRVSEFGVHPSG